VKINRRIFVLPAAIVEMRVLAICMDMCMLVWKGRKRSETKNGKKEK